MAHHFLNFAQPKPTTTRPVSGSAPAAASTAQPAAPARPPASQAQTQVLGQTPVVADRQQHLLSLARKEQLSSCSPCASFFVLFAALPELRASVRSHLGVPAASPCDTLLHMRSEPVCAFWTFHFFDPPVFS
jgi:hypothetical protein